MMKKKRRSLIKLMMLGIGAFYLPTALPATILEEGSLTIGYDYIIYTSGSNVKARNGKTGRIEQVRSAARVVSEIINKDDEPVSILMTGNFHFSEQVVFNKQLR